MTGDGPYRPARDLLMLTAPRIGGLPIKLADETTLSAAVRIALVKLAYVSDPASHLVLGTLAGLCLPIAVVVFFDRIGFRFGFLLPGPKHHGYPI